MTNFGPKALQQLKDVVRQVLSETRNEIPKTTIQQATWRPPAIYVAKTTTTHTSLTSKPIQFYSGAHPSTVLVSTGTVNAYNYFADIAQGQYVMVAKVNGAWVLVAGDPCTT